MSKKVQALISAILLPSMILALGWNNGGWSHAWSLLGIIIGLVLIAYSGILAVIFVHEVGHLLAGKAAQFQLFSFRVGPFSWYRSGSGIKFQWTRGLTAGFVVMSPKTLEKLRARFGLLVAGGPLASLILSVTLAVTLAVTGHLTLPTDAQPLSEKLLQLIYLFLLGISIQITFVSLKPGYFGGIATDGRHLLDLWQNKEKADRTVAHILVGQSWMILGKRARDWDADLLALMLQPEDGSAAEAAALLYNYYHALDSGQHGEAGAFIQRALTVSENLSVLVESFMKTCLLEAAYWQARYTDDLVWANRRLDRAGKPSKAQRSLYCRAAAAIAMREGEHQKASLLVEEAKTLIRQNAASLRPCDQAELEWLNAILTDGEPTSNA